MRTVRHNGKIITFMSNILRSPWLSRMAIRYHEYCGDMGYQRASIDVMKAIDMFCVEAQGQLEKMDLYYRISQDGSINARCVNLIDPEKYEADAFGGLTWELAGVRGNMGNAYLNTNFNPALLAEGQKYQLNDASRGGCVFDYVDIGLGQGRNIFDGAAVNVGYNRLVIQESHNTHRINTSATITTPNISTNKAGLIAITRYSSTNIEIVQKEDKYEIIQVSTDLYNGNQQILSAGTTLFSGHNTSLYFMGAYLSYNEIQELRVAENNYSLRLGLPQIA